MSYLYKTILFDFDGTVFDTIEGITKSVQYALAKHGIRAELSELRQFAGPPLVEKFVEVYGVSWEEGEQLVLDFRERYNPTGVYESAPFPGIGTFLFQLKDAASAPRGFSAFARRACRLFRGDRRLGRRDQRPVEGADRLKRDGALRREARNDGSDRRYEIRRIRREGMRDRLHRGRMGICSDRRARKSRCGRDRRGSARARTAFAGKLNQRRFAYFSFLSASSGTFCWIVENTEEKND